MSSHVLQVTLQQRTNGGWPVVALQRYADQTLTVRREGLASLDLTDLTAQVEPARYGRSLGETIFRDQVLRAFTESLARSDEQLHVLLQIEAPELRTLRWERLQAPFDGSHWDFLAREQRTPTCFYIPSAAASCYRPVTRGNLQALVLSASPQGERWPLPAFDAAAAARSVRAALGVPNTRVLALGQEFNGLPTLDELASELTARPYTVLHVICHGQYRLGDGETFLHLCNRENAPAPVSATDFIACLRRVGGRQGLPPVIFLANCESACAQAEGALGGLAQRLVRELGTPAVVAMTDRVSQATAAKLAEKFYRFLAEHGEPDRALVEATAGIQAAPDFTVPALFSRLEGNSIFSLRAQITDEELRRGMQNLEQLVEQHAPVLESEFRNQTREVLAQLRADQALDTRTRERAIQTAAVYCDPLGVDFESVARGDPLPQLTRECPFVGLAAFSTDQNRVFFGRDKEIEELSRRLRRGDRLCAVVGPSGCGKSSLVLAGLVGELQKSEGDLAVEVIKPGDQPAARLRKAVVRLRAATNPLLVVDQLEELFTQCVDLAARESFLTQLLETRDRARVVVTLRDDFLDDLARYREFASLLHDDPVVLAPLAKHQLRNAIERQADQANLRLEAGLSAQILDDAADERGMMSLVQQTMVLLWERRHGRWLRNSEYHQMGGVGNAVAATIEKVWRKIRYHETEMRHARTVLARLTWYDERDLPLSELRDVRNRVPIDHLSVWNMDPDERRMLTDVVHELDQARLLTQVGGEIEAIHDEVIREWMHRYPLAPAERRLLVLRQQLGKSVSAWERDRHWRALEHRGAKLRDCSKSLGALLNSAEHNYLQHCNRAERARQIVKWLIGLLILFLFVVLGITYYVTRERDTERRNQFLDATSDRVTAKETPQQAAAELDKLTVEDTIRNHGFATTSEARMALAETLKRRLVELNSAADEAKKSYNLEARLRIHEQIARIVLSLSRLGDTAVLLAHLSSFDNPTVRTRLISELYLWLPFTSLTAMFATTDDRVRTRQEKLAASRQAASDADYERECLREYCLILALAEAFPDDATGRIELSRMNLGPNGPSVLDGLLNVHKGRLDPGIHAAADWVLREKLGDLSLPSDSKKKVQDLLGAAREEFIKEGITRLKPQVRHRQWYVNSQGTVMVYIPAVAEFLMGSHVAPGNPPAEPHRRKIPRDFCIAATEVTVGQVRSSIDNPDDNFQAEIHYSTTTSPTDDHPMHSYGQTTIGTWMKYCDWLSRQQPGDCKPFFARGDGGNSANGFRPPTEAEWEYACRAGAGDATFFFGDDARVVEDYDTVRSVTCTPIGSRRPSPFGLFDLYGNVREICLSDAKPYHFRRYEVTADPAPESHHDGERLVYRGGDCDQAAEQPLAQLRHEELSAQRGSLVVRWKSEPKPLGNRTDIGLRLAHTAVLRPP
jgi:formylglycine-generating enzyme required for sulfatase activity